MVYSGRPAPPRSGGQGEFGRFRSRGLPGSDPLLPRPSTRRTELVGSGQVDAYRSVRPSLVRGGRREVSVEGVSMDSLKPQPRETVPVPPSRRIPRGP